MKKSAVVLAVALLVAALGVSSAAFAQSSGNFTYGSNGGSTHCVLQSGGQIIGGQLCEVPSISCGTARHTMKQAGKIKPFLIKFIVAHHFRVAAES